MLIVLLTIILAMGLTLTFYKFYKPNLSIKTLFVLIALIIIDILICVNVSSDLFIPLTFVIFIVISFYENKKATSYNILISIFCFLLFLIGDSITFILLNAMLGLDYTKTLGGVIIYGVVIIAILYLLSSILSKVLNMFLKEKIPKKNGKIFIIITLNIIFSFLIIYMSYVTTKLYTGNKGGISSLINLILIIGYMISSVCTAYFFNSSYKNEMRIKLDEEEMKRIIEYSSIIDEMYMGIRKFKHDYINILSSLNNYIDEGDWEELEIYFKENILPTKEFVTKNDSISKLYNLRVTYLKALISSKIVKAESLGIKAYIDISEEINNIEINPVDLCRALGILLDNAIEGALESEEKILSLGMVYKGNSIVVVVENSCRNDLPPVFKMLEKSFSTKGQDRGFGLYTFKEILTKYNNVTYTLNVENMWFTSEIWIRNGKRDS